MSAKVIGQKLNVIDPGILDLLPGNLFKRSTGNATLGGDLRPAPLHGLKPLQHVDVKRFHAEKSRPKDGFVQPTNGSMPPLTCNPMAAKKKTPKRAAGRGSGPLYKAIVQAGGEAVVSPPRPKERKAKRAKIAGFMREVLALNIRAAIEGRFPESPNKPKALAERAGVSLSTVQRLIDAETGASLDNIELVAGALSLSVYQLLTAGLNVNSPAVIAGDAEAEQLLFKRWKRDGTILPKPRGSSLPETTH